MTLGEIAYSEYSGPGDVASVQQALSSNAKVCCLSVMHDMHLVK